MEKFYAPERNVNVSGQAEKDRGGDNFDFEKNENLSDVIEPGAFYRGIPARDALSAIMGNLFIDANPKSKGHILGACDNVSLRLNEAVAFAPSSRTRKGENFLCAIGFDPAAGSKIEKSDLNKDTCLRFTGPVKVTEVVLRFAGQESGKPKKVRHFSPKEFVEWYGENMN